MGIQTNLKIRDVSLVPRLRSTSGNFYGSEIRHGIFWGLNFGPGIFWVLFKAQGIFRVFIFAPIQSSLSLEIRSTPPPDFFPPLPISERKEGTVSTSQCVISANRKSFPDISDET